MKPLTNFLVGMVIMFVIAATFEKVMPMWLSIWVVAVLLIGLLMANVPSSEPEN